MKVILLETTTEESIEYFKRYKDRIGQIRKISIERFGGIVLYGERMNLHLKGLLCGYRGGAPHGSIEVLTALGICNEDLKLKILTKEKVVINQFCKSVVNLV